MKRFVLLLSWAAAAMAQVPRLAPHMNFLEPCRGKVTVVAFIVTKCPHCQAFSKTLEQLTHKKPICAAEVAFDEDGDITAFARNLRLTFPVLKLERGVMNDFMGVPRGRRVGTPQIAVIDRAGMIQAQSAPQGSPLLMQPEILGAILDNLIHSKGSKP